MIGLLLIHVVAGQESLKTDWTQELDDYFESKLKPSMLKAWSGAQPTERYTVVDRPFGVGSSSGPASVCESPGSKEGSMLARELLPGWSEVDHIVEATVTSGWFRRFPDKAADPESDPAMPMFHYVVHVAELEKGEPERVALAGVARGCDPAKSGEAWLWTEHLLIQVESLCREDKKLQLRTQLLIDAVDAWGRGEVQAIAGGGCGVTWAGGADWGVMTREQLTQQWK
jgi:hypothetical protein